VAVAAAAEAPASGDDSTDSVSSDDLAEEDSTALFTNYVQIDSTIVKSNTTS
jgi:hypothetical protein